MINSKNIIQQGELAKYQLIIEREGFSMTEGDFQLRLTWGMRGDTLDILKADMAQDETGQTFFQFPTDQMLGRVDVECRYRVPDSDAPDGVRQEVERQPLCWVNAATGLPRLTETGIYQGLHVSYVRRSQGGLRSLYRSLRDVAGCFLRDANGLLLRALKQN